MALSNTGITNRTETEWVALMCLSSTDGEQCLQPLEYQNLQPYQKVSRIPGLRDVLWRKDALCATIYKAQHTMALQHSPVSPACWVLPNQLNEFIQTFKVVGMQQKWVIKSANNGRGREVKVIKHEDVYKLQASSFSTRSIIQEYIPNLLHIQKSEISVTVFALVTSASPLRLYLHKDGSVYFRESKAGVLRKTPNLAWNLTQLCQYLRRTHGALAEQKAIYSIKQAVVTTLLIAEPLLKNKFLQVFGSENIRHQTLYQCQHCFQLLSVDLVLNESFHAFVLEVDGQPSLSSLLKEKMSKIRKCAVAEDAVRLLFESRLVARRVAKAIESIPDIDSFNCDSEHSLCLSDRELVYLLDLFRERHFSGNFEQIYPTVDGGIYDHLIADLKSERSFDQHDQHTLSQRSTVELHKFLTQLMLKSQEALPKSHEERGQSQSNFAGLAHQTTESGYQESLINNVFGDELLPREGKQTTYSFDSLIFCLHYFIDGCSDDKENLPYLKSLIVSQGQLNPAFHPSQTTYNIYVGHETTIITVEAVAAHCKCQARFGTKLGRSGSVRWVLDIGPNTITVLVTDISHTDVWIMQAYVVYITRAKVADSKLTLNPRLGHQVCSLVQECDMAVFPGKRCGLQHMSHSWLEMNERIQLLPSCYGSPEGRWIQPCRSCSDRLSCLWSNSTWLPYDCVHRLVPRLQLKYCWRRRKVMVIGDSLVRGIMYYMLEQLNGTLNHWSKSHGAITYAHVGDGMSFTFTYYPQFWLPINKRPVFERSLYSMLRKQLPLRNSSQTVLIIGGLQWLNEHHLNTTNRVLQRMGLTNIKVIVKGYGSGFTQPADDILYHDFAGQQKLIAREREVRRAAERVGFHYINTFNMTIARYKHFLYGRCSCHYHSVEKLDDVDNDGNNTMLRDRTKGVKYTVRGKYTVKGEINALYSEILLSSICHKGND
ncbi:uncharacterized protein LOC134195829 isoform X2 [Corticium candelabrum]|uniref:uncharacterized protein LOC134195829 isoform X2 n=1 Tax=Corticium candelabrum TaxID=121492 RepID=UPI002E265E2C|nr:uncharacterized protein LOC134195829 isoform X2 [Corticium candelabrum]